MNDSNTLSENLGLLTALPTGRPPIFSLDALDLSARRLDRAAIERVNPHRGSMSLLDWIVWTSADSSQGVGLRQIRGEPFWDDGAGGKTYPEALLLEAGAQMACFLYNARMEAPKNAALLRIEDAHVAGAARAGDDLYILCADVRFSRRRFVAEVQGLVGGRILFDARITGMGV